MGESGERMQLSVSNIAWARDQDKEAAAILHRKGIDGVEIAPTKYWPAPLDPSEEEIEQVRLSWEQDGLPILAMQSLLFGMPHLNLFPYNQAADAVRYASDVIRVGSRLGVARFVFGSPRNRDRRGLTEFAARSQAVEFFSQLAAVAHHLDAVLCIEPNPLAYGCNFLTNTAEAMSVVAAVDHAGLGLNLDSGILFMSNESPDAAVACAGPWLKHFHVSHPHLAPVTGNGPIDHAQIANALRTHRYRGAVSIEMRATNDHATNLLQLNVACDVLNSHYRR